MEKTLEHEKNVNHFEASFSALVLSIASHAAVALGLEPNPQSNETQVDLQLARFNVDLLMMLKEKTKNNLSTEESRFLEIVVRDLQLQFVQVSQRTNKS